MSVATQTQPQSLPTPPKRKPVHFRPGTVALREIRREQKSTQNILQRTPFVRMVRDIVKQYGDSIKFGAKAMNALQDMTEAHMIASIKDGHSLALYSNRKSLKASDLALAEKLSS